MKAKHVELIAVVAEAGSLGAAALILKKSQPAVSKALQAAEAEIGCQIFQRSPTGAVPTVEGRRVVARCQSIRRELDLLTEDVAQMQGEVRGTLNLVVSPLAATRIVPRVLTRYLRRYPEVQVQIIGGHARAAFQRLRAREADYVIGPAPEKGEELGLRSKRLLQTGLTIGTGRGSRYLGETDPEVLQAAPWLMIGPRNRRPLYEGYFNRHGLEAPRPRICSDSILTIMSLLEGSDYLCSFPSELFPNLASKWEVAELTLPLNDVEIALALTAELGRVPTLAALAFEDMVEAVTADI